MSQKNFFSRRVFPFAAADSSVMKLMIIPAKFHVRFCHLELPKRPLAKMPWFRHWKCLDSSKKRRITISTRSAMSNQPFITIWSLPMPNIVNANFNWLNLWSYWVPRELNGTIWSLFKIDAFELQVRILYWFGQDFRVPKRVVRVVFQ